MRTTSFAESPCAIAQVVDVLGDAWTMLVLREAYYGETRFDGYIATLHIARNTLASRLRRLVEAGLLERRRYQLEPERFEYLLTDSGRDFFPVMAALKTWGDRRLLAKESDTPVEIVHENCGHALRAEVVCADCGAPVRLEDVHARAGGAFPAHLLDNPVIAARFAQR